MPLSVEHDNVNDTVNFDFVDNVCTKLSNDVCLNVDGLNNIERSDNITSSVDSVDLYGFDSHVASHHHTMFHTSSHPVPHGNATISPIPLCPDSKAPGADAFLTRPDPSRELRQKHPEMVRIYDAVRRVGVPIYRGARVPLALALKPEVWREKAHLYGDSSLADMIEYGFPSSFLGEKPPTGNLTNHASE